MERDFTAQAVSDGICDGVILAGSPFGKEIGFTEERFDGYLWRNGDRILISLITSRQPHQGHLSELFAAIEDKGLRVAVPTPLARMRMILEAKGFKPHGEWDDFWEESCEIWERPPDSSR